MPDISVASRQIPLMPPPENIEQAPVWLARAIQWSAENGGTDIHLFPSEIEAMLWVRIDGNLVEVARYPLVYHSRMIARLKVLGQCTDYCGEVFLEGRFALNGSDSTAGEARLSILPTMHGDKAVIRLLPGVSSFRKLDELGFEPKLVQTMRDTLHLPQGMVLAVGASGCGKSTALYALLHDYFNESPRPVAVVTVEDPVEQSLPFAAQINVDAAHGLGFVQGLRAILRQDPEIIMIGEIRDAETATIALQAALTGHRLISSMHTLSGAEALVRMRQMGAPAYVIASAMAGVLSVRLARVLCPGCRHARPIKPQEMLQIPEASEWTNKNVYESIGCAHCLNSGFYGRSGLGEWTVPTEATAEALYEAVATSKIAITMETRVSARDGALRLLREGKISMKEWQRLGTLSSLSGGAL